MDRQVEILIDAHAMLGEGPCWDQRDGVLWWVDIIRKTLHRYDPTRTASREFNFDKSVSAAIPRRSGGLVVALRDGFYSFDPEAGALELIAQIDAHIPANRINDAKCDRAGRLWGGTMAADESPEAGSFYQVDRHGQVHLIWDKVTCSNGIGWSPDDRWMYYVDSGLHRVDVCNYEADSGLVTNRRPFVSVLPEDGEPDGLTVDSEGFVWVALWGGGAIRRYGPDGRLAEVVRVPALNVTSCTFGDDDLGTLYITSAISKTPAEQLRLYPNTGAVFQLRPGVNGLPTSAFAG